MMAFNWYTTVCTHESGLPSIKERLPNSSNDGALIKQSSMRTPASQKLTRGPDAFRRVGRSSEATSTICMSALVVTGDVSGALTGVMKACLPGSYLLRRHGLLGMGPCSTISVLCHRLTDLLTLSLGLGLGWCA
jgi:hypothetical protein